MKEKRKFFRLKKNFNALIKTIGDDRKPFEVRGINISEEGMMISSPVELLPKTNLKIKIKNTSIECIGVVVYVKSDVWHATSKRYLCGIHFKGISKKNKQKILRYIQNELKKCNWQHWL